MHTHERSLPGRIPDWAWERHANPWSVRTRFLIGPLLLYALYGRHWRLLAATLVFTAANPVLFPTPERTDSWESQAVLAERWWFGEGHRTFETTYPGLINYASTPAFLLSLVAALSRKPVLAAASMTVSMVLKVLFVHELVRRYRASVREE
ncbi:DUF6653 family protein [Natronorarus salvus]|uniref:DUF6653 family protein n=1 Tax=Natronorarus salvus TaxID=3117733 RepID=UPI002F26C725